MIRLVSLTAIGAASFATVYLATAPREPEAFASAIIAEAAPAVAVASGAPAPADATAANTTAHSPQAAIRNVTPADMTARPAVSGPLERVAAAAKPAPAGQPARMERLYNPLIVSAGAIQAKDRTIGLAGIAGTDPEATCGEKIKAWPCGRVARTALRNFIHGRAIDCEIPAGADAIPDPAHCVVGDDDIAKWLVAQGWAKASGDTYADTAKTAIDTKLGLYGDGRPDAQADELAVRR